MPRAGPTLHPAQGHLRDLHDASLELHVEPSLAELPFPNPAGDIPLPNHSHIIDGDNFNPIWWQTIAVRVTDERIWPDVNGGCPANPGGGRALPHLARRAARGAGAGPGRARRAVERLAERRLRHARDAERAAGVRRADGRHRGAADAGLRRFGARRAGGLAPLGHPGLPVNRPG